MKVATIQDAWKEVNKIFPTDYEKDEDSSRRAGYDIYRHPTLNYYNRICDLGCRLEVLTGEYGETVTNIWIEEEVAEESNESGTENAAALPGYGEMLAEKIRTTTTDFSKITDFEKFLLDRGWAFKTEEALRAGYDRAWKCSRGILLTEDEFAAEAGMGISDFSQWSEDTAREVYNALAEFAKAGKITASEVYRYAYHKWCLRKPEAIVAYQEGRDKWIVNNCDTEISEDEAKVAVNSEWGFEASRIKIIGTPYYDATDWQFIRFDCAHMTWLWKNGNLYQVYA
ncbi:MAG: hypothetical protein VB053_02245 [Oscillibacter ruminantium]|uniref:hypothetical protein n=1 Tax=Oscillibacter ruminantium TaxID=1263547 RepID=UPI002B2083DA|nr:hypothetical protein [Oscillibacter ruminantium]MEA5041339.1 hypothetical protein [Oscillibacter ruminantium]